MSLLEGILKISIGASYKVDEGIRAIKGEIKNSNKVILNNIPISLLRELMSLLKGKNVSITLKENGFENSIKGEEEITEIGDFGAETGDISYHTANIHAIRGDEIMQFGCIVLPQILFDIIWNEKGVWDVSAVKVHSCLKCDFRTNLCECAEECDQELTIGSILEPEEGIRQIKEDFKKASKAIINYLPGFLVEELIPFFEGKDIRILMPYGHRVSPDVGSILHSRTARRLIKPSLKIHEHHDAMAGGICFPHIHYGIAWKKEKILEIRTIEVEECIRCMAQKHITAWSLGKRARH